MYFHRLANVLKFHSCHNRKVLGFKNLHNQPNQKIRKGSQWGQPIHHAGLSLSKYFWCGPPARHLFEKRAHHSVLPINIYTINALRDADKDILKSMHGFMTPTIYSHWTNVHTFRLCAQLHKSWNDKASSAVHQPRHRHSPLQFDSSDILRSSWVVSHRKEIPVKCVLGKTRCWQSDENHCPWSPRIHSQNGLQLTNILASDNRDEQ